MKYPPGREDFLESSHPDGYSFSYTTSSIQLCAILFQRSPNHILTVELCFHRLVVIQINHAHKSIHTFFCQPADVRFLAGLFCQSADFFIQCIGTAHAKGMKVIGLTGAKNSKLEQMSDVCIKVPQTETYMIQELHLPVYHCLCLMLEERFFGENN